jgi:hypothetical protein
MVRGEKGDKSCNGDLGRGKMVSQEPCQIVFMKMTNGG